MDIVRRTPDHRNPVDEAESVIRAAWDATKCPACGWYIWEHAAQPLHRCALEVTR